MHPDRRIEEIKRAAGGEISASEIRRAAKVIEGSTPAGILMSVVAAQEFRAATLEASEDRARAEQDAWLTLAAAGPNNARHALAWFATPLVDPDALVQVVVRNRKPYVVRKVCERLADSAPNDEAWGAWLLLSWLTPLRLRAMVKAHPKLGGRFRVATVAAKQQRCRRRHEARAQRTGQVNPVIAAQLQAHSLV